MSQELLAKIAPALDVVAKNACLFIGPRTRPRRVVSITAMKTLKIEYEDGKKEYAAPHLIHRFTICIYEPKDLPSLAAALDTIAKNAFLYGGARSRPRRVVAVTAETTLKIVYDDGSSQYIGGRQKRYFVVYMKPKFA